MSAPLTPAELRVARQVEEKTRDFAVGNRAIARSFAEAIYRDLAFDPETAMDERARWLKAKRIARARLGL